MSESDFESKHNKRFHQDGVSNLKYSKNKMKNILLIESQTEYESAKRTFMAPVFGLIRLAGFLNHYGHNAESFKPNLPMLTKKGPNLNDVFKKRSIYV